MKTILEWFLDLSPPMAKLAIEACIKTKGEPKLNEKAGEIYNAINHGIIWANTEQGQQFWDGIHMALAKDAPDSNGPKYTEGYSIGKKELKRINQLQS